MKMGKAILAVGLIFVLLSFNCEAQNKFNYYPASLGITANQILVSRSFNGKGVIETDNHDIYVPKINPGAGLGAGLALMGDAVSWEFGYRFNISDYITEDVNIKGKATIHYLQLVDIKWYFLSLFENKLMMFYNFDFSGVFYRFKDLAFHRYEEKLQTTRFHGITIGSGLGLQIKIGERTAIELRALPEYQGGTRMEVIKGNDGTYKVKNFGNFLLINSIGLRIYLNEF